MSRGGRRSGRPGVAYPQRVDLAEKPRLPVQVPTGQTYGAAQQQRQAQQAVPLRAPAAGGVVSPGNPAAGNPSPPPPPLDAPTERPDEPLTLGITPPEFGQPVVEQRPSSITQLLERIGATGPAADFLALARSRGL